MCPNVPIVVNFFLFEPHLTISHKEKILKYLAGKYFYYNFDHSVNPFG
jgi:hypothetical protein